VGVLRAYENTDSSTTRAKSTRIEMVMELRLLFTIIAE